MGRICYVAGVIHDLAAVSDPGDDVFVATGVSLWRDDFVSYLLLVGTVRLSWARFFLGAVAVAIFFAVSYRVLAVVLSAGTMLGVVVAQPYPL